MKKSAIIIIIFALLVCVLALGFVWWTSRSSDLELADITSSEPIYQLNLPVGSKMNLPFFLKGRTKWPGFEGQFGNVRVVNSDKEPVTDWVPLQATGDWMTAGSHNFLAQLPTGDRSLYTAAATLEFRNENASGLPEKDEFFSLPIKLTD